MRLKSYLHYGALAVLTLPTLAFAALGGNVTTIEADKVSIKSATHTVRSEALFTVHEIQTPAGTVVREYVGTNGTVFGVAWNGPVIPNLRQLMGSSFDELAASTKSQQSGHTHLLIQHSSLIFRANGHMRAYKGSAYIPGMLPQGVTANQII